MKQSKTPGLISVAVVLLVLILLFPSPGEARIGGEEREPTQPSDSVLLDDAGGAPANPESLDLAPNAPQVITAWYGPTQSFGHLGVPQQWVNILGNVSNPNSNLGYSLNGGPVQPLSVGADTWRLVSDGDFNIEIDYTLLQNGANQVVISASGQSSTIVTVDYESGNVWPNPYYIDWKPGQSIQDVAQIVDGQWTVTQEGRLRPVVTGYDRLVAVGDTTWVDYEVAVPITIHSYSGPDPGVGILVRWNGHGNDGYQPHYAHPFGGLGWYRRYPGESNFWLAIMGNGGDNIAENRSRVLSLGKTYIFKMRVETKFNGTSYYSLKVWEAGTAEPSGWDLSGNGKIPDIAHGSVLLVAHRTDASFGDVSITPIQDGYTLVVTPDGEGTVARSPDKQSYGYAEVVRLTPTAAAGWTFDGWGGADAGDLVDNGDGTWSLAMVKDREVTANFGRNACALTVQVVGHGTVDPPQGSYLYDCDTDVTLTPTPDPGWRFGYWTGPSAGELVDNSDGTWSLTMDGDKSVTAGFAQELYDITVMVEGQGIVDLDPDNPYVYSQVATLWPIPSPGWGFVGWSGPNAGEVVDNGNGTWSLMVDGNKEVKAEFRKYQVFIPLVDQAH